jgi:hypothetical protein
MYRLSVLLCLFIQVVSLCLLLSHPFSVEGFPGEAARFFDWLRQMVGIFTTSSQPVSDIAGLLKKWPEHQSVLYLGAFAINTFFQFSLLLRAGSEVNRFDRENVTLRQSLINFEQKLFGLKDDQGKLQEKVGRLPNIESEAGYLREGVEALELKLSVRAEDARRCDGILAELSALSVRQTNLKVNLSAVTHNEQGVRNLLEALDREQRDLEQAVGRITSLGDMTGKMEAYNAFYKSHEGKIEALAAQQKTLTDIKRTFEASKKLFKPLSEGDESISKIVQQIDSLQRDLSTLQASVENPNGHPLVVKIEAILARQDELRQRVEKWPPAIAKLLEALSTGKVAEGPKA